MLIHPEEVCLNAFTFLKAVFNVTQFWPLGAVIDCRPIIGATF